MWKTINIVFNFVGILLILQWLRYKINDYRANKDQHNFWQFRRHKYVATVGGLLIAGFIIIEVFLPAVSPLKDEMQRISFNTYLGIAVALAISIIWAVYLRKLDIFDPERWTNLFIVFLLGCIILWLVFPITDLIKGPLNFRLNGDTVNDFFYCVIGIGMVEEFVKLIPLLIIIRYKNIVREPYDFILYASVAALGFAFIENAMYIQKSNFYAINGRALMSTVAHMTFSSVVGYSVMVFSYKKGLKGWPYLLGGFILAAVMHGFYNFWLINPAAKQLSGLTFLFFMLTTHFWFTMKNKTINASRFYSPHRKLINDKLRYFLIFWLMTILMVSAIIIGVFHGKDTANQFLRGQILAFGFLLYYLSFSFSRFKIAPKMLSAGQKAFDAVIPDEPVKESYEG